MGDLPKRLLSKQWQDRIRAYEELGELLVRETDSVARYAPYFKRIVADTANPRAQEAALATLVSVLTHLSSLRDPARACPPELRSQAADVSLALIEKCLAGRSTIKEKAIQALLLLAQIGALEPVLNQLLKGCQNKVAKVAASCLFCLKEAVRIFGSPPVSPEPILPVLKASFDHSVQEVRTEALLATVEFHAWLGSSFDASIQEMGLRPAQLKELEAAYEAKAAREPAPPTPERKILLSSGGKISTFQPKRLSISREEDELARELESAAGDGSLSQDSLTVDESSGDASPVEVLVAGERGGEDEPRERKERSEARDAANLPPINLLSMLTPDWYREVTTGVWQKRKEQLDNMISWCGVPGQRLQPGDYTKLIKSLREMLADSTTTTVVAGSAIKAMGAVAKGLGRDFLPHARRLVPILLDDFKTKKTLVGAVIHDVLDEMHNSCFTISDITSEVGEGLAHKVPRVRSECLKWISRCVANTQGATVTNLGPLSELLLKCVDDSQAEVRHAAYSVISLLSKYHGDAFTQELSEGDLDRARLTKLKESTRAGSFGSAASPGGKGSSGGGGSAAPSPSAAPRTPSSAARPRSLSRPTERKDSGGASLNNVGAGNGNNGDASSPYSTPSRGSATATPTPTTPTSVPNRTSATRPASLNLNPPSSSSSSSFPSPAPSQLLSYPSQSVKASNSSFSSSQNGAAANGEEANHLLAPLNYSPSPSSLSSTDSPVGKAREGLSALRAGLARQLEALEQRLEEAEARSAEDHLFAADMHAWNLQLVEQQKADQQRIKELEEACRTAEEERAATGAGREYLPGPEELSAMTRDDLTELERRQEEYLLTIRKIKISLIR